jgi:hypothetical protein
MAPEDFDRLVMSGNPPVWTGVRTKRTEDFDAFVASRKPRPWTRAGSDPRTWIGAESNLRPWIGAHRNGSRMRTGRNRTPQSSTGAPGQ